MPNHKLVQKWWQNVMIKNNIFLIKHYLNKHILEYSFFISPNVKVQVHLNKLVVEKFIYFSNSTQIVKLVYEWSMKHFLVNGCSDVGFQKTQWTNTSRWHFTPNHHRLWKLNTGLQATWAMSFSTLPPDSRTLVSKWNTKLALSHLKRGLWTTGQQSSSSSLSPGKTPLMTTVAKFLDTSVCGALDVLTPASVHSLWSSPKFLNWFCLTILIRLRFSRLVVHLFPSTQLSVNMLGYSTLWTASLVMNVCGLPSLWRVSMIVFWTTVRSAVFPMIVSPSEPNWDHFEGSGNLCRCFELINWLAPYYNLLNWWVFVKCEPKSSQLKEPKT